METNKTIICPVCKNEYKADSGELKILSYGFTPMCKYCTEKGLEYSGIIDSYDRYDEF